MQISQTAAALDETVYVFDVFANGDFLGADSDGCVYDLDVSFRDGMNLSSASGAFDPACESGGANFIDAAFWEAGLNTATWFVSFRGESFTLTMRRQ